MRDGVDPQFYEEEYQRLKKEGYQGWGAESFEARMKGWAEILSYLNNKKLLPENGAKILEIGCGAGDLSLMVGKLGYSVIGCDLSETALQWAREKFKAQDLSGDFYCSSVHRLNFAADESIDFILDGNCLHCLVDPDLRRKSFMEFRRVLKKNGKLFINHMVGAPKQLQDGVSYDKNSSCLIRFGKFYRYIPEEDYLINEMISAGFSLLDLKVVERPWWKQLSATFIKKTKL